MAVLKIPTGVGQLLFCEQTSWTTIGTPNVAIEAIDIDFKPTREVIEVNVQSVWPNRGPKAVISGAQGGTLTFKTVMRGGNGAESATSKLLKNCGYARANYADKAAVVTAADATSVSGLNAGMAGIAVNQMILVKGGSTAAQIRFVTRVQLDTPAGTTKLTIAPAWAANPSAGDTIYAMDTFTPSLGEPTKYLAFYWYPGAYAIAGTSPYYLIQGCAGLVKLGTMKVGGLPTLEWTFQCDAWSYVNAAAPALTADAFAAGHPLLGDTLTIDAAAVAVADFGFDPGMDLQPYSSINGTNGRAGWLYTGCKDPKIEFTPYFDDTWISTRFSSLGSFGVLMESIKSQTNAWAVYAPKCYAKEIGIADAGNGHLATKPTCILADPGLDGAGTTNLARFAIGITSV